MNGIGVRHGPRAGVYPAGMLGTPRHFLVGAATCAVVGLGFALLETALPRATPLLDGLHLLSVGVSLFLAGAFVVSRSPALLPDPSLRKGPAPRAFWAVTIGVAAHALAAPLADEGPRFWASMKLGGSLVEGAALLVLLAPLVRPAAKLTPPGPSGTEGEPSGS